MPDVSGCPDSISVVMAVLVYPAFWGDRGVLVTGQTGFMGAWLTLWLPALGARVVELADGMPTSPSLYELARVANGLTDEGADIRDTAAVRRAFARHDSARTLRGRGSFCGTCVPASSWTTTRRWNTRTDRMTSPSQSAGAAR